MSFFSFRGPSFYPGARDNDTNLEITEKTFSMSSRDFRVIPTVGYLISSVTRLSVVVIGDDCTTDLQCQHSINNSRCRDGYCSCLSGYRQDVVDETALNTACVRRKQLPRPICVVGYSSVGNILLLLQPFPPR